MKKYLLIIATVILTLSSCKDFLNFQPEYLINENSFYKTSVDFETALIGTYSGLQDLHNVQLLFIGELMTDNAKNTYSSVEPVYLEFNEVALNSTNTIINSIWNVCFKTISRSNNILSRIDNAGFSETLKSQYKGEALFLRAYCYFYLVRMFGDLPLVEVAFRSPNEIATFDMSRKPAPEIYKLIISDLENAAADLKGVSGLSKSRASTGAAKTLLGKVYLTQKDYPDAAIVLKDVIDMDSYSLMPNYKTLFTNGNDELSESVFEIKYLSGNVGEGNTFTSFFTPNANFFTPNALKFSGTGRMMSTANLINAFEPEDMRRATSIADSVLLLNLTYEKNKFCLKFVDFTTGTYGDGGINFTSLRYADVLLMYAETLNETGKTTEAHTYLNMVRNRAGLASLSGLSQSDFTIALEKERRVEFMFEGQRWFDLVRTGRTKTVLNKYFADNGLKFRVEDYELLMPIPQQEIDINPKLVQNPGY